MDEFKLINQHDMQSHGMACVAMATGASYEEYANTEPSHAYNRTGAIITELVKCGKKVLYTSGIGYFADMEQIVSVPCLNVMGGMHWIYLRNGRYYDPQRGRLGMGYYSRTNLPLGSGGCILIDPDDTATALVNYMENVMGVTSRVIGRPTTS